MPQSTHSAKLSGGQVVFVGGVVGFDDFADPANTALLRATGRVGLYMQDYAISLAYTAGETPGITAGMAGTGPGEAEWDLQKATDVGGWYYTNWLPEYVEQGLNPTEVNVNIDYNNATWTTDFTANVDAAKAHGISSYAPIFSPNNGAVPLDSFANNPFYANIRAAAIYGGGIAIDAPPAYFFSRGINYQQFIYQEIQWAHQNGLRVSVIISPYGDDPSFGSDAAAYVKLLQWNNAIPSEYVVENYTPNDPNGVGSDTNPNSMAGVALWVAQNALTGSSANTPVPTPTLAVSAPGTVQEPSVNGGVTVTENISSSYLAGPVYYGVLDANGNVESSYFQSVLLDSNGNASVQIHLARSGDYVVVENDPSKPTAWARSNPVTITEPQATMTVSAPGTLQEQQVNAGVIAIEEVKTTNITGQVYFGVVQANGYVESSEFLPLTLNANGVGYFSARLLHTGDVIAVTTSLANAAVFVKSSPVTITEPAASITLSAPGVVAEPTKGAGVVVTETVSTTNVDGPIYVGVLTPSGNVESSYFVPVALDGQGNGTFTIHMNNSGDTILAENSLIHPSLFYKTPGVTIVEAPPTITLSAPGTVQEAYPGAGATVTETVTTTNLTGSITYAVVDPSGNLDGSMGVVQLGANGTATFQAVLDHTGDAVLATDNPAHQTAVGISAQVTITDPTPSITLSNPGTVQETSPGAGVTVTDTIATTGLAGPIYYVVINQAGQLDGSSGKVSLGANGSATIKTFMHASGDVILAADNPSNPTAMAVSPPVTITDPSTASVSKSKLKGPSNPMTAPATANTLSHLSLKQLVAQLYAQHDFTRSAYRMSTKSGHASHATDPWAALHKSSSVTLFAQEIHALFMAAHSQTHQIV